MISHSLEETYQIAVEFTKSLCGGETVLLKGELGAGKTLFVRAVAESLGYRGVVRSPTFTIMNIYPLTHESLRELVHLDLYRINKVSELSELGLDEWLNRKDCIVMIEWPMEDFSFDREVTIITFEIVNELTREIWIETSPKSDGFSLRGLSSPMIRPSGRRMGWTGARKTKPVRLDRRPGGRRTFGRGLDRKKTRV